MRKHPLVKTFRINNEDQRRIKAACKALGMPEAALVRLACLDIASELEALQKAAEVV
jgi:predicted DNA-binding protein